MKFLFKKWLEFETGHGTEAGVSEVKQSAQRYLEGKGMQCFQVALYLQKNSVYRVF